MARPVPTVAELVEADAEGLWTDDQPHEGLGAS
jgi:hypothetical protein